MFFVYFLSKKTFFLIKPILPIKYHQFRWISKLLLWKLCPFSKSNISKLEKIRDELSLFLKVFLSINKIFLIDYLYVHWKVWSSFFPISKQKGKKRKKKTWVYLQNSSNFWWNAANWVKNKICFSEPEIWVLRAVITYLRILFNGIVI